MCQACYQRNRRKTNPEAYAREKDKIKEYQKNNREKIREYARKWRKNNHGKVNAARKQHSKKYIEKKAKLIEQINKWRKENIKKKTCSILKKHSEDLKDDPEHLTTEFIQQLIGIKCKKER